MNERIKYLRKELLHLTLEQFGAHIGLGKSAMSRIESGSNIATDQTIKSICREFGVREEWIRSGEGDPLGSQTRNQRIQAFANQVMADEEESFRKRLVDALSRLDLSEWEVLEKIALDIANKDSE